MGKMDVHIGEMLARNARMYPDDLALVERAPAAGKRTSDHLEGVRAKGPTGSRTCCGRKASRRATRSSIS